MCRTATRLSDWTTPDRAPCPSAAGRSGTRSATTQALALPLPGDPNSLGHSRNIRIDGVAPTVLSVSSPDGNGTYGIGSHINITVTFSEDISVTGVPELALETGTTNRTAVYYNASSTARTLAFTYTVEPGDAAADLGYAGTGALDTRGAITDEAGNPADPALPLPGSPGSLGGSKDIAIDTTPRSGDPARVLRVYSPDAGSTHGAGSAVNITVVFSRAVNVTGAPLLALLDRSAPERRVRAGHGRRQRDRVPIHGAAGRLRRPARLCGPEAP